MTSTPASTAHTMSLAVTSSLYASGKYSDLTITCQDRSFAVHRAVVCLQSKPIAAMVDGEFKESITRVIDFPENHLGAVEKMVDFMYHGDYSDGRNTNHAAVDTNIQEVSKVGKKSKMRRFTTPLEGQHDTSSPESDAALLLNAHVYAIAELYDIPRLKELAKNKFEEIVSKGWNVSSFLDSLKLIYELTPQNDRALKIVAAKVAAEHPWELFEHPDFSALCRDNGEIAYDVLLATSKRNLQQISY